MLIDTATTETIFCDELASQHDVLIPGCPSSATCTASSTACRSWTHACISCVAPFAHFAIGGIGKVLASVTFSFATCSADITGLNQNSPAWSGGCWATYRYHDLSTKFGSEHISKLMMHSLVFMKECLISLWYQLIPRSKFQTSYFTSNMKNRPCALFGPIALTVTFFLDPID